MPGPWEDYATTPAAAGPVEGPPAGPWMDYAKPAPDKPFLEKLGNFASKVWNDPPPSIAAARDVIKGAPAAATELTYGADPQAAEQAAGTIAGAAQMGLGFRGLGGEGVFGRRISTGKPAAPVPTPVPPVGSASQQAVEAGARLPGGGVTLPGYIATEGTVMPQVAAGLKNVPWAGQPIVRSAEELTTNLGRAAGEIAPAVTSEAAGERAKTGLTSFITTGSKKPVSDAYKAVDALVDPEIRVPLTNTAELVQQMRAERANARIPGSSRAIDIVSDAVKDPLADVAPELRAGLMRRNPDLAQPPGMNYTGTKDLRSYLGERTPQELIAEGINPTEAKRIYGALTKDLGTVLRQNSPEAFSAWKDANVLARQTKRQQEALAKVVGVRGDAAPEQVLERLATFAKAKAGADMLKLRLAKQAMGPDAWGEVGSALINRLGKAAPDTPFSPDRFVTAWGNMSGAAKQELFSGQQAAALNDLFIVSNHVKERITKYGNPSGTARGLWGGFSGSAIWAEPLTAITTIVGTRLAAEAMSRPAIVRAATRVARASLSGNPVATRRALAALRAAVQAEGLLPRQGR